MPKQLTKASEEWGLLLKDLTSRSRLWSNEYSILAPKDAIRRRRSERSLIIFAKAFAGLFFFPKRRSLKDVEYILENLRNIHYVNNCDPASVLVIGSWNEAKYAKSMGYKFCWSYPIECSLILQRLYNVTALIDFHSSAWCKALKLGNKKFVLLYEDTQPIGCFFAALTKLSSLNSNCKTICIQHGYFPSFEGFSTIDGSFSEFNFVWDVNSIIKIGCDPLKAFEIGPQFQLKPANRKLNKVVFVGPGSNHDGTGEYNSTLQCYHKIISLINFQIRSKAAYRPHPCELADKLLSNKLQRLFDNVEYVSKREILTEDRHVFVGTSSSLLFEADYCGHIVIILDICKGIKPFKSEFVFRDGQEELAAQQINRLLLAEPPAFPETKLPKHSFCSAIKKVCSY